MRSGISKENLSFDIALCLVCASSAKSSFGSIPLEALSHAIQLFIIRTISITIIVYYHFHIRTNSKNCSYYAKVKQPEQPLTFSSPRPRPFLASSQSESKNFWAQAQRKTRAFSYSR